MMHISTYIRFLGISDSFLRLYFISEIIGLKKQGKFSDIMFKFPNYLPREFLFYFIYFIIIIIFYCSGFCHTLKWNSHGFTCVPHPAFHVNLWPIILPLVLHLSDSLISISLAFQSKSVSHSVVSDYLWPPWL